MSQRKTAGSAKKSIKAKEFDLDQWATFGYTKDEISEIKRAFDLLDSDKSGSIDPAELKDAFQSLGVDIKDKILYQILAELDDDASGAIEFREFHKLCTSKRAMGNSRKEIESTFNMFDNNGNGKLTVNELRDVALMLGEDMSEEELEDMFKKADGDNDGFVTADDFYTIIFGNAY